VILVAEAGLTSLGAYRRSPHVKATSGGRGARRRAHGRDGEDALVVVPPGTVARRHPDGEELGEVLAPGDRLVLARGGRGGRGNVHFATPTHQAPRHYERGDPGEEGWIELELKLIAEVGFVGAPNAGKSTLLAALTAARPEVGAYPFTTTTPNLGVLDLAAGEEEDVRTAVIADVPGLIEGAHRGEGLGHEFLRHVERCRVLLGVVDGAAADPVGEWRAVAEELRLHDPRLLARPIRLAVTKMDLPEARDRWPEAQAALRRDGHEPIAVSAHDGTGLDVLRAALADALVEADRLPESVAPPARRVHRFDPTADGWEVVAEADGLRVRGRGIERTAARTDFTNPESRDRFQRRLERLGIDAELRRRGAREGTTVRIGALELEWGDEP
jgi:GTP-binding protein